MDLVVINNVFVNDVGFKEVGGVIYLVVLVESVVVGFVVIEYVWIVKE